LKNNSNSYDDKDLFCQYRELLINQAWTNGRNDGDIKLVVYSADPFCVKQS